MTEEENSAGSYAYFLSKPIKLRDLERWAIEAALRRTKGSVTKAMRELGIGRTTMYRKIEKYDLRGYGRCLTRS